MENKRRSNAKKNKALSILLELLAFGIIVYLAAAPFYPMLKYNLTFEKNQPRRWQTPQIVRQETTEAVDELPAAEIADSPNRLIITKIGVNAPIVESNNDTYGLSRGAWRVPDGSTPKQGGNTIITGHRFKYLPPNNVTFYLFDRLERGDIVSVLWNEEYFYYRIKETKVVPATDVSILDQTDESILTLFTCDPIWSTKNRLVIVSELINEEAR